jgi:hypothetical protein
MLIKESDQLSHDTPDPSAGRWTPPRVALIVLGALFIMLPVSYAISDATTAGGAAPAMSQTAGCTEVSPRAVDLLGAVEGQPPIPDHGVLACK